MAETEIRTTVSIPTTVLANLHIWSARKGLKQNAAIVRILTKFLAKEGLQPLRMPKEVKVSY